VKKKNGVKILNAQIGKAIGRTLMPSWIKPSSRFHTLDNLGVAAQFINDAIIVTFEVNCPLKSKNTSTRISCKEFSERRSDMKKLFYKHQKDQKHRQIRGYLRAPNVNTVKRLLSLRAEAKGISAKSASKTFRLGRILNRNFSHLKLQMKSTFNQ